MLTYQQCQEIVSKNENFYEKVDLVNGYKISVFNYILSIYPFSLSHLREQLLKLPRCGELPLFINPMGRLSGI